MEILVGFFFGFYCINLNRDNFEHVLCEFCCFAMLFEFWRFVHKYRNSERKSCHISNVQLSFRYEMDVMNSNRYIKNETNYPTK